MFEVIATRDGYVNNALVKSGEVFILEEKHCKKSADGKFILPLWVEAVKASAEAKAEVIAEASPAKKAKDKVI